MDTGAEPHAADASTELEKQSTPTFKQTNSWRTVLTAAGLYLATFCMTLDHTILATAIPKIADEFHSVHDVAWYSSSYIITGCALQLSFGKLYTLYSTKVVFLSALWIFELGNLVAGAAPNSTTLILGRAIAGIGAVGILVGAMLIIADTVSLKRRGLYLSVLGAIQAISTIIGPQIGGAFTDHISWRACFYINLPFGLITMILIGTCYSPTDVKQGFAGTSLRQKLETFDVYGTALFIPMMVVLFLTLEWAGSRYAWSSPIIIVHLVSFLTLLSLFILSQYRMKEQSILPLRVLRIRTVWSGLMFCMSISGALFTLLYYLPTWFQVIKDASASHSATMNLPMVISLVIASVVAGLITSAPRYCAPTAVVAASFACVGAGLIATLEPHSRPAAWIGYQIICGIGFGLASQVQIVAMQAHVSTADLATATAALTLGQGVSAAISLSLGENVFVGELVHLLRTGVPELSSNAISSAITTFLVDSAESDLVPQIRSSYNSALSSVFSVAMTLAIFAVGGASCFMWKAPPPAEEYADDASRASDKPVEVED